MLLPRRGRYYGHGNSGDPLCLLLTGHMPFASQGYPLGLGGCPCRCWYGRADHKRQSGIPGSNMGPPCRVIGHAFPEIQCYIID